MASFLREEEVTQSADHVQRWHGLGDAQRERKRFRIGLEVGEQGHCLGNS